MLILEVPYGQATSLRLGRLRAQSTGLYIAAPTIASGDFKITQDDGVGEDNVDNIPTIDTGTGDMLWTISAAEATTPSANGPYRVMHAADAAGAEWLDRDFLIVTTDHPQAAKPNGIIYGGNLDTPASDIASNGTTMTLPATPASWEAPSANDVIKGWWCEVFDENGVRAGGYVKSYATSTRVLTFDDNCPLRVDFTSSTTVSYRLYPDNRRVIEDILRIAGTAQAAGNATAGIASLLTNIGTPADTDIATDIANLLTDLFTQAMTESYSTDGGTLTLAQALYELVQRGEEISISDTTMTIKKRDGSTTAKTLTLGDAANPTTVTRAS